MYAHPRQPRVRPRAPTPAARSRDLTPVHPSAQTPTVLPKRRRLISVSTTKKMFRIKLFFDGPDSNGVLKLIKVDLDGLLKAIRDHSKVRAHAAQTPRATAISSTIEPRPHSRSHPPSLPQSSPLLPSVPLRCRSLRCPR